MSFLKLFFSNDGKIRRLPYFNGHVILVILMGLIAYYSGGTLYLVYGDYAKMAGGHLFVDSSGLFTIVSIMVLLYCSICLTIKRFRDAGCSPWWTLLLPFMSFLIFIFLMIMPSKKHPAHPKEL